jgi:DNA-binding response OmpR family regulator
MAEPTKLKAKILVVDDEPNVLRMVSYALYMEGYEVIVAQNGTEAINKVQAEAPNLILLDVMLPDISGIEVCAKLRQMQEAVDLPIIMLSAKAQVPDKVMGLEAGADEYVTKPITPGELLARIKALLVRYQQLHRPLPKPTGKVLGFMGAKGGVGTTTAALNVAAALVNQQKKVLAAEIRPSYGTFTAQLNLARPRGLTNLLILEPEKINEREINSNLTNLPSGLRVLVGPQCVADYRSIAPQYVEKLISIATTMVDYLILDLPCDPSAANQAALGRCDFVAFVIEPEPSALASGVIALEQMRALGVYGSRVGVIVVNRVALSIPVKIEQIKTSLENEVIGVVPTAAEAMITCQQAGLPLSFFQPTSNVSKAFGEITKKITEIVGWTSYI